MERSLDMASDADLLAAARRDPEAFAAFYRRHERIVLGWLMRQTRRAEVAADLAAETFAAAYLASGRFRADDGTPAIGWLLGIARNKLRESVRRGRIEERARERMGLERIALDDADLARVEALDGALLALLEELPAEQREAVRRMCSTTRGTASWLRGSTSRGPSCASASAAALALCAAASRRKGRGHDDRDRRRGDHC
jgi:RNA polymerase sigma-70 factor (ECF subfamily)